MEIKHLQTFRQVAELLSFHLAGERLHLAQSTVSAQIKALEQDLGVRLFDRLGRSVTLTQAGERLLQHAVRITDMARAAKEELTGEGGVSGTLVVRAPESLAVHRLAGAFSQFLVRFPNAGLRLTTCARDSLPKELEKGEIDLAFLLAEGVSSARVEVEALAIEDLVLAAGPAHPLAGQRLPGLAELAGQTFFSTRVDCSYRQAWEQTLEKAACRPRVVEFGSVSALLSCLRLGDGLAVLPRVAVEADLGSGRLALVEAAGLEMETACLMIRHRGKWLSPALRALMELARQAFAGKSSA